MYDSDNADLDTGELKALALAASSGPLKTLTGVARAKQWSKWEL